MDKLRILIVDDDPNISRLVSLYLEKEGYETECIDRGDKALEAFRHRPPGLVLLDVMLPGMDGYQVLREIRKISNLPVVMLTAKDETFDEVLGLELGADDYITKPFDPKKLVARVKAVTRRTQVSSAPEQELAFNNLVINHTTYTVIYNGKEIDLPPKEFEVLYYLASNANHVFTRDQLLEQIWGFDFYGDFRTVDVHIKRLREKLEGCKAFGWEIRTVWSVGYKFEVK